MTNMAANYKIKLDGNTINIAGVKRVESVADKQAVLFADGKIVLKGSQISLSKLDLDAGTILLTFTTLDSIAFGSDKGKVSLKGLLK